MLEQRNRARVERRREAVEDAREREVGADAEPVRREHDEHLLLRGVGLGRPLALLLLGRVAAGCGEALGDGGREQDDDPPLRERDLRM